MTARVLKAPDVHLNEPVDQAASDAFQHALEEAFARGREIGAVEATSGLQHEVASLRAALETASRAARSEVVEALSLDAAAITALASDLVAWFLDDTAATEPAALLGTMQAAVAELADVTELVLYVHPDIAEAIATEGGLGVDAVRADPSLDAADFRLVSDGTLIERRWQDTFADLQDDLIAAVRLGRMQGHDMHGRVDG